MANQPGPSTSSQDRGGGVEDLVECPICYAPFERPLQLSCGHTLCGNCVDKLVEGSRQNPIHNIMIDFAGALDDDHLQRMIPHPFERPFRAIGQDINNLVNNNQQGLGGGQDVAPPPPPPPNRYMRPGFWDPPYDPMPHMNPIPGGHRRIYNMRQNMMNAGGGQANDGRGTVIKCPECRAQTNVPAGGLPVNYRLQDMIARLNAQSACGGRKAKVEVIKCERCDECLYNGCYYTCKNGDCQNDGRSSQLCATCGIRHHNGHTIEEHRVLTDRDIAEAKEAIGLQTARATQAMDMMTEKISELSIDARELFVDRLADAMKTFDTLATSMDSLLYNSLDTLGTATEKAMKVADKYEQLSNEVVAIVDGNKRRFEELTKAFNDFLRGIGLGPRTVVKIEPSEDDVIIVEPRIGLRGEGEPGAQLRSRRHQREAHRQSKLARMRDDRMTAARINNQRNSVDMEQRPASPTPRSPRMSPERMRLRTPERNERNVRPRTPERNLRESLEDVIMRTMRDTLVDREAEPMRERVERMRLGERRRPPFDPELPSPTREARLRPISKRSRPDEPSSSRDPRINRDPHREEEGNVDQYERERRKPRPIPQRAKGVVPRRRGVPPPPPPPPIPTNPDVANNLPPPASPSPGPSPSGSSSNDAPNEPGPSGLNNTGSN